MMALRTPSLEGASRLQGSTLGCNPGSPASVSRCGPWSEPLSSWRLGSATPAGESSPPPPGTSFMVAPETEEDRCVPVLHFFGALA